MREKEVSLIPDNALEALARRLYPLVRSYFESEEGQREFAEWQTRQGAGRTPWEAEPSDTLGLAA